ncbi:MAG: hypothetical protein QM715_05725 [Nibricoccus sp.]
MNAFFTRTATFCFATLAFSPFAHAALETNSVPADAKWIIHLDLDAVRESPVGKEIVTFIEKNAELPKAANVQIDIKKVIASINSATAYGTTFSQNPKEIDGTLILQGTDELRKIAEAVVTQFSISNPEIVSDIKGLPFAAYSIKNEVTVAFPPEPIILMSRSQPQLLKGYDLLRGKGPAAARGPSSLKGLIPKTRPLLVFAASEVPNTNGLFPENQPQARILKMAKSASIAIGQNDKLTTATLQLVASDDDLSEKLHTIVKGLVAMLSLAQSDDQQLNTFLQSAKTERNGRTVIVNLSYPTEGLLQMIRAIAASENRQRANRNNNQSSNTPAIPAKIVSTWIADKDLGNDSVSPETLQFQVIENVALKNGTTISLNGRREGGENARFDYIDVIPTGGGGALHFEAENLRLSRYSVERTSHASGGKVITLQNNSNGHARFEFPGADGTYTLKVGYVDENDGKATFSVSLHEAAPAVAPAAPQPPTPPAPPAPAVATPAK